MKKVLSLILIAGMVAGSVSVAAETAAPAEVLALVKSGATLDKLTMAVYQSVKAQPAKAVEIFNDVISQRESWSVTDTYAVLRSVLLAVPSLESSFVQQAAANQGGAYDVSAVSTQGYQLLASLYSMPQTQSVAAAVVQGVVGSSTAQLRGAGNGVSAEVYEAYVPSTPVAPEAPEYTVTPTPPPTSANN